MKLFSRLSVLLTTLLLSGCQTPKPVDVPPVTIAFDHNNINQEYKMNVTIEDPRTYSVVMNYYLENPDENKSFSNGSFSDDKTQINVEDYGIENFENGTHGVSALYQVKIYDLHKEKYIMDEIITNPRTSPTYMGSYASLVSLPLSKGRYIICVTYLQGAPELSNAYTTLEFSRAHHGK
ncbi:DUF5625 family protein [Psychrobacter urativorans]|uniref:DUF5625 family protein n=1 Tax=Psychrobacter urativorans TaxID=45610 RepID=UPI0019182C90|nr:DUF5625 family protein [Psychrobacter urativorans]